MENVFDQELEKKRGKIGPLDVPSGLTPLQESMISGLILGFILVIALTGILLYL